MDKIDKLYQLYKSKGIITDATPIEKFRSATEEQKAKLYELGKSKNLFQTTDINTFSSAWGEPDTDKKKEESALFSRKDGTLSATPKAEPQEPSASFVKGKVKTPSIFNKNIEDSDFKKHQELYRSAKKAIESGDRQAFLQSKKSLDDLRNSYGSVMSSDVNLSEDYNLLNTLSEEKFKKEKQKEIRFIQEEEKVPFKETKKKQLEKSIEGYESDVKYTPEERVTMLEIQRDLLESVDYDGIDGEVSQEYSTYSMKPMRTKIGMLSIPQVEGQANDAIKMAVDELVAAGKEPSKEAVLQRASEIRKEEVKNKREYEAIDDKYKFSSIIGKSEDQEQKAQALESIKKKRESHAEMFRSKVSQLEAFEGQVKQYEELAKEQGGLSDIQKTEALDVLNKYKRLASDITKNYSNIENDTENIGDFDAELDAFKRNHTYLTSASVKSLAALEKIAGGIAGGAGMVNNIMYDLTGNAEFYLKANDLLGIGKGINESAQGMLDGVSKSKQLEDVKDAGDAIEWAGALMVENTPQILINVLTNGQAIPFLSASAAGEKYMEIYGDDKYSNLQKYAASILVGAGTAVSEKLELAAFNKLWPSKRLAKAAIEKTGREAFEKSLSEGVKKGISDVFSRSKKALAGVNQEGVSEVADQLSRNLVDKYVLDREDVSITDGLGEAYLSGAVVGAGLGAAPHVFSSVVRPFVNDPNKDILKNVNKIQKLNESLATADDKMKPIIQERIDQLRGRNEEIIQKAVNSFDSLSPLEVKEAIKIYEDITSLKKEYSEIKEDTTIPPDVKEALLESVFTKYNSLVERRLQILKKAEENAVQEQTTSEVPVQPEATVGEEVAQGEPQAESEVAAEEEIKIDVPSIVANSKSEVDTVVAADLKEETGQTFNIDGTVYSDGGLVVPVVSENLKQEELTPERIADFVEKNKGKIGSNAVKVGIYKFPNKKEVSIDLNIVVPRNNREAALEFGKIAGQESLFDLDTFENIKTGSDGKSPRNFTDEEFRRISKELEEGRVPETGQQQTLAAEQGTPTTIEGTGLRENIKKSIAKVFKSFDTKSFKNAKEMAAYAKTKFGQETGASDAARIFVTKDGKVEVLVNEESADDTAFGHEVWHAILLKAFGDNQAKFAEFRGAIDKTLRQNGYEDIADSLDEFSSQYTEEGEVPAEEYLAQLGGLMTSANIDLKNLTPAQKSLLQQIKDIINDFAIQLTGQPVFLKEATPETILDFMSTMSDMMTKGEDISGFFVSPTKTDKNGNLPKPSSRAQKSLKDKNKEIEKNTKAKVEKGDNVSTRIPSKGNPHSNSDLIVSTSVIIEAAKTDKNAKDYALKLANILAQYPNVNIDKDSIKTIEDAQEVFEKFKENVKSNLKWLYDQFSDEVRTITKLWYDGANIVSNEIAKQYGYTTNQVAGVMAVLSPQMDWFRNLSLGKRVIDIYNTKKESTIDEKMEEYIRNANTGTGKNVSPLFEGPAKKLTEKSIDLLLKEMRGKKFKDMSIPEKAFFVRAYDEVYNTRDYENISPTGEINGFVMTDKGARAKVGWGGFGPIMKAISILESGSIDNISENLGNQHKVRNFFVNISNPNDTNAVTIDTHAVAAALLKPLAGSDAEVSTNLSGPPRSASTGLVGSYPVMADAYRELAKELGILPRELQSITWEAVRGLYKASFKTAKNKKAINEIWEKYKNGEININQLYEEVNTKAGGVSKPVWYEYVAEGDVKTNEENSAAVNQGELSDDYRGEGLGPDTTDVEVKTRAQKTLPDNVAKRLTEDGNGNYVFHHYSRQQRDKILPSTGSGSLFTSKEEQAALSSVGGMAMYYAQSGQKEAGVGNELHTIVIPKDKIYYMNEDVLDFYSQAKEEFLKYMNRGKPREKWTQFAFEPNYQVAFITKIANENGFEMVVSKWRNDVDFRAQTTLTLKPEKEDIPFKKSDSKIEAGDKVFIFGQEGLITEIDDNGMARYTSKSRGGRINIKESQQFRPGEITLLEKGPFDFNQETGEFTTRAQKAQPQTIPGYDRMIGEAKGIVSKSKKRGLSADQIAENVINYIQKSKVYERADDLQREQIIRDARKDLGLRQKSAPRVDKLLGKIKDIKKVTVSEKSALKELLKAEAKGARTAVQARSQAAKTLNDMLKALEKKGSVTTAQVRAIMTRYSKVNFFSSSSMDNFVNYMAKVFSDAEYSDKLKTASKTANAIRRLSKNDSVQAGTKAVAKKFLEIDPRLVEDIDKYLEFAKALNDAVRTSMAVNVDGDFEVLLKKAIDYNEFQDYMEAQITAQEEYIKNQLAEIHKDLIDSGAIDASMSLADMKAIIDAINYENENSLPSEEKERMIRTYLESVMDSYAGLIDYMLENSMDPFSLELISISDKDRQTISKFMKMDLNKLPLKEAYSVVEAIENFIVNKNVDNMGSILAAYEGGIDAESMQRKGTKARPIRSFFSKKFGRVWAEQIEQLQITMERMFGGIEKATEIMRKSGVLDISQGKTKAVMQSEKIINKYTEKFGKIKDFNSAENIFERKIISFMTRTINGSDIQKSIEFERRKRIVDETITAMENGSETEVRDAAIAREVYDKVLKGAKTPQEVASKSKDFNNEAVKFWIDEFSNIFDELQSVSRSVYNTILERDINYTPDRFKRFEGIEEIIDITGSSFAANNESYDTKKSGTLMANNRIKTLGKDPKRVLSFDFDTDMSNAMLNALIDINTAYAIRKAKSFYESDSFGKMVPSKDDRELIRRRVKAFITKTKRKEYVPQSELAQSMKAANLMSQIAVGRALGSLAQVPKQTISVVANTMINSDGKLAFVDVINAKDFIDNSGYSIALRGIASNADVQTINKMLERQSESTAQEIQRGLNRAAEMWLNSFIARPDVWAARLSWVTYYKESLRKQGIDADNIDWSTHEMNQKAGDYAQAQVNRQQNYSDSDFAGELLGSKDPMKAYTRKVLFSYMTFVFNQKSRQMADIAILSNKTSSKEDKKKARKSLYGLAAEMATYSLVGYFIKEVYAMIVNALIGEDDDEEDKDKRLKNHLKYGVKTMINDLLSPIPNITDTPLDLAINKIMKVSGVDEDVFSIPEDKDKSLAEVAVGPSSIVLEGMVNLERMSYAALTGTAVGDYKGKLYERELSKENQDLMKYVTVVYTAYLVGAVPADMGRISEQVYRKLLKNSKKGKSSSGIKTSIDTKIK